MGMIDRDIDGRLVIEGFVGVADFASRHSGGSSRQIPLHRSFLAHDLVQELHLEGLEVKK
jgi:hypothetical protein